MTNPIVLLVNESGQALDALEADLARRFAADYQIGTERSPLAALRRLEALAGGHDEVALIIAAQAMAELPGVDFMVKAHQLAPGAKRMLVVGRRKWTASNPAVRAMTLGLIDDYLFEPWLPLGRFLYLPVSQVLSDWVPSNAPSFEGIRIVGPRWGSGGHELRDTLTRMGIPHGWYPTDSEEGRRILAQAGQDGSKLPVVLFHNGMVLLEPTHAELLEALGFGTRPNADRYDVAIVGAGFAGLAAATSAASEGLETLVVEPEVAGGQAGLSAMIRNYPGFPRGISGFDLANRTLEQAWLFGANLVLAQHVTSLRADGDERVVTLSDGQEVRARAVVLASGVAWRRLTVPRLEALIGAGVFYGAAGSEAKAMGGQRVVIVGAGNSAGQAAIHLAKYAGNVTIVGRGDALGETLSEYLVRQIEDAPNIDVRLHSEVVEGWGRDRLEGLTLRDNHTGATEDMPAAALFVLIGADPHTDWLEGTVERDERGYVLTGHDLLVDGQSPPGWPLARPPLLLETSIPGVFAAGDVRARSVKRVSSAIGEGAVAVQLVHQYLNEQAAPPRAG